MLDIVRHWWHHSLSVGPVIFGATVFISFILLVVMLVAIMASPSGSWSKAQALCDDVVPRLLHSNDLVEVTRAGIIVDRLDCRIRRRL